MTLLALISVALLTATSGDSPETSAVLAKAVEAVNRAERIELISVDASEAEGRDWETLCQGWCYFGWPVLGTARLEDTTELNIVRAELKRWIAAPEPDAIALCFFPRHGVRIRHEGHVYDFTVCYECGQAQLFRDFEQSPSAYLYYSGSQAPWDKLLRVHGVPLAKPPKPGI